MRKIIIIGASGYVGEDLYNFFIQDKYKVVGTAKRNLAKKSGIKFKYFDLGKINSSYYGNLFKSINKNDVVLFLPAYTDKKWVNLNYNKAKTVNLNQSILFLKKITQVNCKLVFLSSVEVFNGKKGNYSEKSNPKPNSHYGNLKYSLEKFIRKNIKKYLIIRTGWIVTRDKITQKCIISKTYKELLNGKGLYAKDIYLNILSTLDLYRCIKKNLNINKNILVHLSSDTEISRADLALKIVKNSKRKKNMSFKIVKYKNIKNKEQINQYNFLNTQFSKNLFKHKFNKIDQIVKSKVRLIEKLN